MYLKLTLFWNGHQPCIRYKNIVHNQFDVLSINDRHNYSISVIYLSISIQLNI